MSLARKVRLVITVIWEVEMEGYLLIWDVPWVFHCNTHVLFFFLNT